MKLSDPRTGPQQKRGNPTMRIYVAKDYHDMSRKAANIVSAQVIMKPNCVLGWPPARRPRASTPS